MKTYFVLPRLLSLGGIAAFTIALTAISAHAGPGPQYWEKKHPAPLPAAKASDSTQAGCTGCKTEVVREYITALPNGKGTPRLQNVGTRHSCTGCATVTTTVRGKTTQTARPASARCTPPAEGCCR